MGKEASLADLQLAVDTLAACDGSSTLASEKLGIARSTLQSRVQIAQREGIKIGKKVSDPDNADHLRQRLKRVEQELRLAKETSLDEKAVRNGIIGLKAAVETVDLPDWMISPHKSDVVPGVPTVFLSDLHWGEVVKASQVGGVNQYNIAIAHDRIHALADSAVSLLRIISPKLQYPGIVLALGGDMISGNIHDELTATNEINSMGSVLDLFSKLVWLIEQLVERFGKVFIPCVTGNHGRDTHKIWNKDRHATSFDWLLYCFLAKRFEADKRITFLIPDGPDAYYRVYGQRYLLTHGDQFRGGDGMIGALGPIIRGDHKKRSRNAQIDMEYDTLLMGHWHQYIHIQRLIVNGSLKGYDEYAYNNNFGYEPPQQAMWITHPKYRITFRMPVFVDRHKAEQKPGAWVSVK